MDINTKIFREHFLQYYRPLCLFALHYLKDIDDAEDTVQDCFMELWRRKTGEWIQVALNRTCMPW